MVLEWEDLWVKKPLKIQLGAEVHEGFEKRYSVPV